MRPPRKMRYPIIGLLVSITAAGLLSITIARGDATSANTEDGFDRFVESDGTIRFDPAPIAELTHLGSWFVPAGGAAGFHHVYAQRSAIDACRHTGTFPDGTVLVKELRGHQRGDYTTGQNVAAGTGVNQWFVMVKDVKGRFPANPLWGDGWGWALFKPDAPSQNLAQSYKADCLGCHTPASKTDWVYVGAYPALRE